MANSSMESAVKANLLGKRKPEDDLEINPRENKQKETTKGFADSRVELLETKSDEANLISVKDTVEGNPDFVEDAALRNKMLFAGIFDNQTVVSDIIDFFKDAGEVVGVRFIVGPKGRHAGYGFVEFASANEANKALRIKNGEYLHKRKILLMKVHDETPDFVEEAAVPRKTLFVGHISRQTEISDIINFFNDVGQVVHVRLVVSHYGKHVGCGFVEFASANEAKKALEKKKGEYLHGSKIFLDVANKGATYQPPMYCIDHRVWYEDYLGRESLPIEEDDEDYLGRESLPIEEDDEDYLGRDSLRIEEDDEDYLGRESLPIEEDDEDYLGRESLPIEEDETPRKFVQEVLLVANISPQTTRIVEIFNFFKDVGEVVGVRLIVNHEGKNVGYGFVEFSSAYAADEALEKKNGEYLHDHKILLMKGPDETPDFDEVVAVRNKTLVVANLCHFQTEISDIIDFFKDVGEVVHVRLFVGHKGKKNVGFGFVEFASANEAKEALEQKNGEYLHDREISLDVFKADLDPQLAKYFLDDEVWYEDYSLQRESLLIEEDAAAVEGLDETLDFAEEAVRKKTLFVSNVSDNMKMGNIIQIVKHVGEVVRARLCVDHRGEHLGCGFVEFASAYEAKKALEEKNGGHRIFLNMAERARYPFRPKYKLAEKLWCEENLRRESLAFKIVGKKTTFSYDDD